MNIVSTVSAIFVLLGLWLATACAPTDRIPQAGRTTPGHYPDQFAQFQESRHEIQRPTFTTTDRVTDVEASLTYACRKETPATATTAGLNDFRLPLTDEQTQKWKTCFKKLPDHFTTTLKMEWNCVQSDPEIRPLPGKAEIPVIIRAKKGTDEFDIDINFGRLEVFLKPALTGNTNYYHCRNHMQLATLQGAREHVETSIKKACGEDLSKKLFFKKITYKAFVANYEKIETDHLSHEATSILLPTILPFYSKLSHPVTQDNETAKLSSSFYCSPMTIAQFGTSIEYESSSIEKMGRAFIENEMQKVVQDGPACASSIASFLVRLNSFPEKCFEQPQNKNCQIAKTRYQQLLAQLDEKFKPLNIFSNNLSFRLRVDGSKEQRDAVEKQLAEKDYELRNRTAPICEALRPGDKHMVKSDKGINGSYRLSYINEQTSEVRIFVNFQPVCEVAAQKNLELSRLWLDRVNKCLETANPHFKGPNDKRLKFVVEASKDWTGSYDHSIQILNEKVEIRENSGFYSPATTCATLIHEILHLTGLADEYRETQSEYRVSVNGKIIEQPLKPTCRIQGPNESIMSDHVVAFQNAIEKGQSLLKPAHFRFIAYPNCAEKNSVYFMCSRFRFPAPPSGCAESHRDLPESCTDGSFDWINK